MMSVAGRWNVGWYAFILTFPLSLYYLNGLVVGPLFYRAGDTATLEYSGKDGDKNDVTSDISMVREGGAWKLAKESSTTHTH